MTESQRNGVDSAELRERVEIGLRHCREGNWELGVDRLGRVAETVDNPELLPGAFYSYLGHGVAKLQGDCEGGLRLCLRAVELEFYNPQHYVNLAQVHLLRNARQAAIEAVQQGLSVVEDDEALNELLLELGARRPPVVRAFGRKNLVNRVFGRLRHDFIGPAKTPTA